MISLRPQPGNTPSRGYVGRRHRGLTLVELLPFCEGLAENQIDRDSPPITFTLANGQVMYGSSNLAMATAVQAVRTTQTVRSISLHPDERIDGLALQRPNQSPGG